MKTFVYSIPIPQTAAETDFFGFLPDPRVAAIFAALLAMASAALAVGGLHTRRSVLIRVSTATAPYALFASSYTAMYGIIDEVAVNLEHSVNWNQSGLYSFRSDEMLGGTVELLYYAIHAPFSSSAESAVWANFGIGLAVGLLHVAVAQSALRSFRAGSVGIAWFALFAPMTYLLASGFGNGLVSLATLSVIALALRGSTTVALLLAALLPLVRPDGLAWAYILQAGVIWWARKTGYVEKVGCWRLAPLFVAPILSLSAFGALSYSAFGTANPVPVRFKAVSRASLAMFDSGTLFQLAESWVTDPFRVAGSVLILAALALYGGPQHLRRNLSLPALLGLLSLPLVGFYAVSAAVISQFGVSAFWRYALPADSIIALGSSIAVALLIAEARSKRGRISAGASAVSVALLLFLISLPVSMRAVVHDRWVNRDEEAFAGQLVDEVVPTNWTVGTTEMNTFGLLMNRPVIDYWGYTNASIADSSTCNGDGTRYSSSSFLSDLPDVFFPYWLLGSRISDDFESALAHFHHVSRSNGNRLGDMTVVMRNYDVVILAAEHQSVPLLVRQSKSAAFVAELTSQSTTSELETRAFDFERFWDLYMSQEFVSIRC